MNFNYDLLGRITSANGPWGKKTYGNEYFDYDDFGNITKDNNNRYSYGLDGHLLNTSGSSASHYQYDTNGHRIVKTESHFFGKQETIGFYTKSGDLLMEYNLKENKSNKYIYLNGHKVVKVEQLRNKNNSKVEYFYNDAIGSPVAMADSKGNTLWHQVYEPFGIAHLSKGSKSNNKFLIAGKEKDDTDLSYFGARYYSANQGRFMSPDPVEVQPDNPNTFNRYVYANNNPYKYVDPDGRSATEWFSDQDLRKKFVSCHPGQAQSA